MYKLSLSSQSCNTDCKGKKEKSILIIMYYVHAITKNLASGLSRIISILITAGSHQLCSCSSRLPSCPDCKLLSSSTDSDFHL